MRRIVAVANYGGQLFDQLMLERLVGVAVLASNHDVIDVIRTTLPKRHNMLDGRSVGMLSEISLNIPFRFEHVNAAIAASPVLCFR